MAEDPVQLLGIVSIFESIKPSEYKEYWWRIRGPWLLDKVPSKPVDFVPVTGKR